MRGAVRSLAVIGWVLLGAIGLMLVVRFFGEAWFERVYWEKLPLVSDPRSPWALLAGAALIVLDVFVLLELLFGGKRPKRMTFKDTDGDELVIDLVGIEQCLERMLGGEEAVQWAHVEVDVSEARKPFCRFEIGLREESDLKTHLKQLKAKVVARFEELLRLGTELDVRAYARLVPSRRVAKRAVAPVPAAPAPAAPAPVAASPPAAPAAPALGGPKPMEFKGIEYPVDKSEGGGEKKE